LLFFLIVVTYFLNIELILYISISRNDVHESFHPTSPLEYEYAVCDKDQQRGVRLGFGFVSEEDAIGGVRRQKQKLGVAS
jgi:hypothetical protein